MWSTLEGLLASNIASQTCSNELPKYLIEWYIYTTSTITIIYTTSTITKKQMNWRKKTRGPPNKLQIGVNSPPNSRQSHPTKKQRWRWLKNAAIMAFRQPLVVKNTVVGEGWEESTSTNILETMCYGLLIFDRQEPMLAINICIPRYIFLPKCILYWA